MKPTYKTDGTELRIYQSLWKNLLLIAGCSVFATVGWMIIRDDYGDLATKILGGWLNVVFFGGCGFFLTVITLYNRIRRIPHLVIYEDRLELYVQRKGVYRSIDFADVRQFRFIRGYPLGMIAVDYKPISFIERFEESSDLKRRRMNFDFRMTGAIENIPVINLTMNGKAICELLNGRSK